MTVPTKRSILHRMTGLASLLLFAIFMGSIVLAKLAMMGGFTVPRLSAQTEFLLVLTATFLAVNYLLREENWKAQTRPDNPENNDKVQPEEEKP